MAIKTFIVVLLSLALLSCSIFFMTPFPANLALTEKVADLSKIVKDKEDECEDCYYLHYLNGYLFLVIQHSQLIILDADLNVLKDYTNEYAYGSLGYWDNVSTYYIGTFSFDGAFNPTSSGFQSDWHGFYDGASGWILRSYDCNIETQDDIPAPIDSGPIPCELQLRGLTFDPLSNLVYLFFGYDWYDGDGEVEVLKDVPVGSVTGGLTATGTVPYPYGSLIIYLNGVDARTSYFTRDGFVGLSEGFFRKFDLAGNEASTLRGSRIRRQAAAFDINGDFFFYYDGEGKKIYRCRTWWE